MTTTIMQTKASDYSPRKMKVSSCSECGGQLIQNSHELTCNSCGLVHDELQLTQSYNVLLNINQNIWKTSKKYLGDQMVNGGTNIVPSLNLGSEIGYYSETTTFRDFKNHLIPAKTNWKYLQLKRFRLYTKIKNNETIHRIFQILNEIAPRLKLSKIQLTQIANRWRKINSEHTKIRNQVTLLATLIYAKTREDEIGPSIKQIIDEFKIQGHSANARLIIRDHLLYLPTNKQTPRTVFTYLTPMFANLIKNKEIQTILRKKGVNGEEFKIQMNENLKKMIPIVKTIINQINPVNFAGALIYAATVIYAKTKSRWFLTQKHCSAVFKISEYSIRDLFSKHIKKNPVFQNLLKKSFQKRYGGVK